MLKDLRDVTYNGINHLSKEQLFQTPAEGEFPIGAYLMHFAECDVFWLEKLSQTEQPADLKKKCFYDVWFDSHESPAPPSVPLELNTYIEVLDEARKNFLEY